MMSAKLHSSASCQNSSTWMVLPSNRSGPAPLCGEDRGFGDQLTSWPEAPSSYLTGKTALLLGYPGSESKAIKAVKQHAAVGANNNDNANNS